MLTLFKTATGDCVRYREVLYHLLARDMKIKYKHTLLGYFWSLLNPIFQIAVLSVVFSHLVRWNMKDYAMYLFSGFIAWTFFQTSLMMAGLTYLENSNFLKKIYLPKILFPIEKVVFRFIDFIFSVVALTLIAGIVGYHLSLTMLLLPLAMSVFFVFTIGASILMAVAAVYFRDILHIQSVFLQLVYFATPILYPLNALPPKYQQWMELNPLYVQIRLFQRLISEGVVPSSGEWLAAAGTAFLCLAAGLYLLSAVEDELVFRL